MQNWWKIQSATTHTYCVLNSRESRDQVRTSKKTNFDNLTTTTRELWIVGVDYARCANALIHINPRNKINLRYLDLAISKQEENELTLLLLKCLNYQF
jgi:hypothetical protein